MKSDYLIIKDITDDKESGVFTAFASTNDLDRHNEIVSEKALKEVSENTKSVPMFFGHAGSNDIKNILGRIDILGFEDNSLKVKGTLSKKNPNYELAYDLMKMGAVDKLSIGFKENTKNTETNEKGQTIFNSIELLETSIVPIPANPNAQILNVKGGENMEEEKKEMTNDELSVKLDEITSKLDEIIMMFSQGEKDKLEEEELKKFKELLKVEKKEK